MGMIGHLVGALFGTGRNAISETIEVFRPNAEAAEMREAARAAAALAQFANEFSAPRKSGFDAVVDGINRLPRPMLAFGTIGLMIAALVDPIWFAARMQGVALVPDPLWWLMGAIVSFYFGARHQFKAQQYEASLASSLAAAPNVIANIEALKQLAKVRTAHSDEDKTDFSESATRKKRVETPSDILPNRALDDWRAENGY